jgi:hypothetical protein
VHGREIEPEADGGQQREADAGGEAPLALLLLPRCERDADDRRADPGELDGVRRSPVAMPKITGTTADAPAIGATTDIVPVAIPR